MTEDFRCGYASIVGRPNVGKSTLLNKLVGQKISITSRKPQTTRWRIHGIKSTAACQIIYIDTPGLQNRRQSVLHRHMQREIQESLSGTDVIILVIEALVWTRTEDQILEIIAGAGRPVFMLINKVDKIKEKERLLPFIDLARRKYSFQEIIPVSARTGKNLEIIETAILPCLPVSPAIFPEDQLSDKNERFFAAEFIREQLTRILGAELPYSISVTIDKYQTGKSAVHIAASIWVENDNQKIIVIGKGGRIMKTIGERARKDMEHMTGLKVFLETRVKVRKKWTSDAAMLKRFGYGVATQLTNHKKSFG